jgi:hypothetical protein
MGALIPNRLDVLGKCSIRLVPTLFSGATGKTVNEFPVKPSQSIFVGAGQTLFIGSCGQWHGRGTV